MAKRKTKRNPRGKYWYSIRAGTKGTGRELSLFTADNVPDAEKKWRREREVLRPSYEGPFRAIRIGVVGEAMTNPRPKRTRKAVSVKFPRGKVLHAMGTNVQGKMISAKDLVIEVSRYNKRVSVSIMSKGGKRKAGASHSYKTEGSAKSAYKTVKSQAAVRRFIQRYGK